MVVVDAEDGTTIAELLPSKDFFEILVKDKRGRFLVLKPPENLKK